MTLDVASPLVAYGVLPALIFAARLVDVSLGTLRILLLSRGSGWAPVVGFAEALVWLLAMGQLVGQLGNPACIAGYAAGFACGNLLGLRIEARLALGSQVVRAIVRTDAAAMIDALRAGGFGVTVVTAEGRAGHVYITYTCVARRDVPLVLEVVRGHHPTAFITIEDIRAVASGWFPPRAGALRK